MYGAVYDNTHHLVLYCHNHSCIVCMNCENGCVVDGTCAMAVY